MARLYATGGASISRVCGVGRILGAADLFQRADGLGDLRRVREDHPGEPEGVDRLRVDPVPGDGEGEGHGVVGWAGWR